MHRCRGGTRFKICEGVGQGGVYQHWQVVVWLGNSEEIDRIYELPINRLSVSSNPPWRSSGKPEAEMCSPGAVQDPKDADSAQKDITNEPTLQYPPYPEPTEIQAGSERQRDEVNNIRGRP